MQVSIEVFQKFISGMGLILKLRDVETGWYLIIGIFIIIFIFFIIGSFGLKFLGMSQKNYFFAQTNELGVKSCFPL